MMMTNAVLKVTNKYVMTLNYSERLGAGSSKEDLKSETSGVYIYGD